MSPFSRFTAGATALVLWLVMAIAGAPVVMLTAAADETYSSHIKPLFAEKCISCHGPLDQNAGLRLDAGELIHRGGDSGDVTVSAEGEMSVLLGRVVASAGDERMPPPGEGTPLNKTEIETLRKWIAGGARFPEGETYVASPAEHWAFQPPVRPTLPSSQADRSDHQAPANPIDAWMAFQQVRAGLRPVGRADSETLLRRLAFGLTGLPPTALQRASFVEHATDEFGDQSDTHRMIDRLLADPAHAQRWARHWMDVWRYSDWDGYKNELRGSQRHIWRWRDWIIDSLAQDKPYDQMIVEMLAADEVAPLDLDALRATGFLARNYHRSNRNIWLDATVEHTAKAFLALTIDCAKCHDHKYDPISQVEYYRFRAIFEPYQTRTDTIAGQADTMVDGLPRIYDADLEAKTSLLIGGDEKQPDASQVIEPLPPEIVGLPMPIEPVELPLWAYVPKLRPETRQTLIAAEQRRVAEAEAAVSRAKAKAKADGSEAAQSDAAVRLAKLQRDVARAGLHSLVARLAADEAKQGSDETAYRELALQASQLQRQHASAELALQLQQKEDALAALGPESEADPKSLQQATEAVQQAQSKLADAQQAISAPGEDYISAVEVFPSTSSGRRLALARWITDRDNPLTARVAVNHIWMRHFGRPLVDNVFDFGLRSPRPVHAELLDWLAVELIESGWSMQHLHRLIVTSDTYALASRASAAGEDHNRRIDPDNALYWMFQPLRLESEAIRDNVLAVAGQIDHQMGGPEIDHQQGEQVHRRSLYFRHAYEKQMTMLTTFDGASPIECYQRSISIIPQQALVLANSELARAMSRELARTIEREIQSQDSIPLNDDSHSSDDGTHDAFIRSAFVRVLGRTPTAPERDACRRFLADPFSASTSAGEASGGEASADDPLTGEDMSLKAKQSLVHALINHNDFVTVR